MPAKPIQLLSAAFLEQLERLSLVAHRPVRGWAAGQRRSRQAGHSVEFLDYRAYGTGDDLRYVDWNIFRRTDRLVVKQFVDDEELSLHLLVDASESMSAVAARDEPSKFEWAKRLAAALGFVGLAGLERVGLGVIRDRISEGWAPSRGRGRVTPLMNFLGGVKGGGTTRLNESLAAYATRARGSGVAVVVSDLMDEAGYEAGLRALLERRFEVHVVHVLSPEEMQPSISGDLRLVDAETGEIRVIRIDAETLRAYRERLAQFLDRAERFCLSHSIGYHRVTSDQSLEDVVLGPLRGRLLA